MMETIESLLHNYYYFIAVVLFVIGFHTMLTHSNLIKKVIAMNIMDTSVFLLFVTIGYVQGGRPPIMDAVTPPAGVDYINPLPSALILTGIIVAISVTAYALSLIVKIYKFYGTIDADEIAEIRGREE